VRGRRGGLEKRVGKRELASVRKKTKVQSTQKEEHDWESQRGGPHYQLKGKDFRAEPTCRARKNLKRQDGLQGPVACDGRRRLRKRSSCHPANGRCLKKGKKEAKQTGARRETCLYSKGERTFSRVAFKAAGFNRKGGKG